MTFKRQINSISLLISQDDVKKLNSAILKLGPVLDPKAAVTQDEAVAIQEVRAFISYHIPNSETFLIQGAPAGVQITIPYQRMKQLESFVSKVSPEIVREAALTPEEENSIVEFGQCVSQ